MRGKREIVLGCGHSWWTRETLVKGDMYFCAHCAEYKPIHQVEWWTTKCLECKYTYGFDFHAKAFLGAVRHVNRNPGHTVTVSKDGKVTNTIDPTPSEPMF